MQFINRKIHQGLHIVKIRRSQTSNIIELLDEALKKVKFYTIGSECSLLLGTFH